MSNQFIGSLMDNIAFTIDDDDILRLTVDLKKRCFRTTKDTGWLIASSHGNKILTGSDGVSRTEMMNLNIFILDDEKTPQIEQLLKEGVKAPHLEDEVRNAMSIILSCMDGYPKQLIGLVRPHVKEE